MKRMRPRGMSSVSRFSPTSGHGPRSGIRDEQGRQDTSVRPEPQGAGSNHRGQRSRVRSMGGQDWDQAEQDVPVRVRPERRTQESHRRGTQSLLQPWSRPRGRGRHQEGTAWTAAVTTGPKRFARTRPLGVSKSLSPRTGNTPHARDGGQAATVTPESSLDCNA